MVEGYLELNRSKAWILVRLCDIDRGMKLMSRPLAKAVLGIGIAGLPVSSYPDPQGEWRRYRMGLTWLRSYLNHETRRQIVRPTSLRR